MQYVLIELDFDVLCKPKKIGLCCREGLGEQRDRYAFIEFDNKKRIVSTIPFYNDDGLTIGEYYQGRINDYKYCLENRDKNGLNTEFEPWINDLHFEDFTNKYGTENI